MTHAIRIHAPGGPEVMQWEDVPTPEPGPAEALVHHTAVGLNYIDVYFRNGLYKAPSLPAILGMEAAGVVRAVGTDVQDIKVGDRVAYATGPIGAYATDRVISADRLVKLPEGVDDQTAAAMMLQGLTAQYLLRRTRPLKSGDTILVHAAAGGVGHLECQMARLAGARVIGIAGDENHDYLRSIGVKPIGYESDLATAVRTAAGGRVTAMLDNYGRYEALAAELGIPASRISSTDDRRDTEIALYLADADPSIAVELRDVAELVAEWDIRVLISGFYPFVMLDRALVDLEARHSRGVVVVGMDPTAAPKEYLKEKMRARHEAAAAPAA